MFRVCDICGSMYQYYHDERFNGIGMAKIGSTGNTFDVSFYKMCPNCLASFKTWFNSRKEKLESPEPIEK